MTSFGIAVAALKVKQLSPATEYHGDRRFVMGWQNSCVVAIWSFEGCLLVKWLLLEARAYFTVSYYNGRTSEKLFIE